MKTTARRLHSLELARRHRPATSAWEFAHSRLHAALGEARRGPLTERKLCALADRIAAGAATADDAALLAAFDGQTLAQAGTTAAEFVVMMGRIFEDIGGPEPEPGPPQPDVIPQAARLIREAGAILSARLAALPDAAALQALARRLHTKPHDRADLVMLRGLPNEWIRARVSSDDWGAISAATVWPY